MTLGQVRRKGYIKARPSAPLLWGEQRLRETFIYYYPLVYPEAKHEYKKRFSSNSRPNQVNRMASICKEASGKRLCAQIRSREPKIRRGQVLYSLWPIGIYEVNMDKIKRNPNRFRRPARRTATNWIDAMTPQGQALYANEHVSNAYDF